ncbi:MAG: hypothetical protein IT203_00670 [Fimbriimonadaceae bacterium]|nr:hypothetical protein [Fimbriimonadaceae bacterium]
MKKLIGACAIVLVLSFGILGCSAPKEGDPAATTTTPATGTTKPNTPTTTPEAPATPPANAPATTGK